MDCNNYVLAFNPFGCSSNGDSPSFKVANIYKCGPRGCNPAPSYYNFTIYSSRTGRWKRSNEVCHCNYPIYAYEQVFTNGKFYWLTSHAVISFDDEEQRSDLILLPPISSDERCSGGHCLGVSQGSLHYVCCGNLEVRVWLLGEKNGWIDKYHLRLSESIAREAFRQCPSTFGTWETYFACKNIHKFPKVVCFRNDVLLILLECYSALISYDLRTGKHEFSRCSMGKDQFPTLIPYSFSFAAGVGPWVCVVLLLRQYGTTGIVFLQLSHSDAACCRKLAVPCDLNRHVLEHVICSIAR